MHNAFMKRAGTVVQVQVHLSVLFNVAYIKLTLFLHLKNNKIMVKKNYSKSKVYQEGLLLPKLCFACLASILILGTFSKDMCGFLFQREELLFLRKTLDI